MPDAVVQHYREQLHISHLFEWQWKCLQVEGVLQVRCLTPQYPPRPCTPVTSPQAPLALTVR